MNRSSLPIRILRGFFALIIPLAFIAGGVLLARRFIEQRTTPPPAPKTDRRPMVKVTSLTPVDVPVLTGEDIYLKEPFAELLRASAIDIVHPDLATAGGILETKKIGDLAADFGVPAAIHCSGSPIHFGSIEFSQGFPELR